jgi:chromosome segregation protein
MRLQRLDIQGFKSFADRTTIRFGEGITGVVGPNGCGKSNIVDAIRWVMGEQSAKHLRGGSMQDVIFNGSEKRGPMGMAEVTLTFENDGRGIPPEYSQLHEIQVTRRLYRDGEADYEINKTPCRLKDVHDLFLGTGIGSKAYSIIQQGQVAELMRVKPEDRRRIIEEAAGITKYKARKEAAVRKMDATRQNLQRIDDVTKEIGRRLGSLRRQAKKAEKYKELRKEVREIELHRAAFKFLELHNAIAFDKDLYETLTASLQGDVDRVSQLEVQIEEHRSALTVEEKALGEKQARMYEIDNGLALNEQAAEHARKEHERSLKRDEEAAVEVERLKEQRAMLEGALAELKKGSVQLELELDSDAGALEEAQKALEENKKLRADEAQKVESLRRLVIEKSTEAAKAASDVVNLKATLEDMGRRKETIVVELAPLADEEQKAKEQFLAADAERASLEQDKIAADVERANHATAIKAAREKLNEANRALSQKKDELQKKKGRLTSLEEIHARYEQSPEAVRALLKRGGPLEGRGKLLVDLFEASRELELPIEAALGTRLQSVVVPDKDAAIAAVEFLAADKKNPKGRAELLVEDVAAEALDVTLKGAVCVLEKVKLAKKAGPAVQSVLSRFFVVEDRDAALALWADAQKKGVTLVTHGGEVLEPTGVFRGGSAAGADNGVLRQKRELRELSEEVATLEAQVAEQQAQVEAIGAEVHGLDELIRQTGDRIQALQLKIVEAKGAVRRHQEEIGRLEQRTARLRKDQCQIEETLARATTDLEGRQARLHEAESARAANEAELLSRGQALLTMDQTIAAQQESVTTMKVRQASIHERREMLQKNLAASERQAEDIEARLEKLTKQIEDGHGERAELTRQETEARATVAVLGEERVALKASLEELRAAYEKKSEGVRVLEHEARAARAALDAARGSHADLTVRIREHELELDAIVDRCIEHHRTTPQEVLFDYHMREMPPEDADEKLADLERQIESLGAINLTAIDECIELEKRHDFLKTQADDLTHALNQLEKAIVKINRTTKKRFQETFEGVNERFQQVFPRLFRGGKAWLALTDPNDMLATGVEIYAQPPGKKLAAITMMSGGEQALTAVSLIFSIFLLKPSPFCVLDEVDAPLDEANVGRFNDMVRDVSALSQFIVITHNKKTMEVADQLYGITMEEAGISKTVNVRIQ